MTSRDKLKTKLHSVRRCLCPLYTYDAADDLHCVDLCGRRIIKKKKNKLDNEFSAEIQKQQHFNTALIPNQ